MKVFVRDRSDRKALPTTYPFVVLQRDNWNDFGYVTLFNAELHTSKEQTVELGLTKIIALTQRRGATEVPKEFQRLSREFCSLGQDLSYYELLDALPKRLRDSYLGALRDITVREDTYRRFKTHPGLETSLLRSSSARTAMTTRRRTATERDKARIAEPKTNFSFAARFPGADGPALVEFSFGDNDALPSRTNVLIGRNGTGKTQYLAYLAIALTGLGSRKAVVEKKIGTFVGDPPEFRKIIAVSYNPFDEFPLPGIHEGGRALVRRTGELFGYVYCGLRDPLQRERPGWIRLRSQRDIRRSLEDALAALGSNKRLVRWHRAVAPVVRAAGIPDAENDPDALLKQFRRLSSGQKLVLLVLAEIYVHLERNSLVLLDEPENHLHPTLLATFLSCFRRILVERDSYSIIATHSPVVLQETPAKFVRVFGRVDNIPLLRSVRIETFGETIGHITTEVFDVTGDVTDYHAVLDDLIEKGLSLAQIERLLDRPLGMNARGYVLGKSGEEA